MDKTNKDLEFLKITKEFSKIVTKNNLFKFQNIPMIPFIYWYIWVFLLTFNSEKTNFKRKNNNIKNLIIVCFEFFRSMFINIPSKIDILGIPVKSVINKEKTIYGEKYLQPLSDYVFMEFKNNKKSLIVDVIKISQFSPFMLLKYLTKEIKSVSIFYWRLPYLIKNFKRNLSYISSSISKFRNDFIFLENSIEYRKLLKRIIKIYPNFDSKKFLKKIEDFLIEKIEAILFYDYFLNKLSIKKLFVLNEYGNMPLVYVAKKMGIKTFALQHGVIHENHPGYIYPKELKGIVPLCDITFLFGEFEKELLVKKSIYDEKDLAVVGNPRMINNYYAEQIYDKNKFLKEYNIPKNKFIITYFSTGDFSMASSPQFDITPQLCIDINNLKKESILLIKLHPNEKNLKKYGIIKKYKNFKIILLKDVDTYELLYFSDLVVGNISTVMSEAVAFRKNIVIYKGEVKMDFINYVAMGVAINREDFSSLQECIEYYNEKNDFTINLDKNRDKFIKKFYYKIDGKATERILSILQEKEDDEK